MSFRLHQLLRLGFLLQQDNNYQKSIIFTIVIANNTMQRPSQCKRSGKKSAFHEPHGPVLISISYPQPDRSLHCKITDTFSFCGCCRLHPLDCVIFSFVKYRVVVVRHHTLSMDTQSAAGHSRMLVIWQRPICEELHGTGLTCLKTVQQRRWLTREIESRLPDNRVSYNGVVDHRHRATASHGVPVYSSAVAGTHFAYPSGMARLS